MENVHCLHPHDHPQQIVEEFLTKGGFESASALDFAEKRFTAAATKAFATSEWLHPADAVGVWALCRLELESAANPDLLQLIESAKDYQPWLGRLGSYLLTLLTCKTVPLADLPSDRLWNVIERGWDDWFVDHPELDLFQNGRLEITNKALFIEHEPGLDKGVLERTPRLEQTIALLEQIAEEDEIPEAMLLLGLLGHQEWLERASDVGDVLAAYHLGFSEYAADRNKAARQLLRVIKKPKRESTLRGDWHESVAYEAEERLMELTSWADLGPAINREAETQMAARDWTRRVFGGQNTARRYKNVLCSRIAMARTANIEGEEDDLELLGLRMGKLTEAVFKIYLQQWRPSDSVANSLSTQLGHDELSEAWWTEQGITIPGATAAQLADFSTGVKLPEVIKLIRKIEQGRAIAYLKTSMRCLALAAIFSTKMHPDHPFLALTPEELQLSELAKLYSRRNEVAHDYPTGLSREEGLRYSKFVLNWTDTLMNGIRSKRPPNLLGVRIWNVWLRRGHPHRGGYWQLEVRDDKDRNDWRTLGLDVQHHQKKGYYYAVLKRDAAGGDWVPVVDASGEPVSPNKIRDGDIADIELIQRMENDRPVTTLQSVRLADPS